MTVSNEERRWQKNREARRQWRADHPELSRARVKAYRAAHPEETKARGRAYRVKNAQAISQQRRAHYQANRARLLVKKKEQPGMNTPEHLAKIYTWRIKNPEKFRAQIKRRRAAKARAPVNDFTAAQWRDMKEHYGHRCVYCGKKQQRLTQDHIVPLSKGGSHTLSNIVPACRSCNCKKQAGPPLVPVQPLLLLACGGSP